MRPNARNTKTALTFLMLFSTVVSGAAVARAQQATAGLAAAFADRAQFAAAALGAPLPDFERPRRLPRNTPGTPDFYWAQRFADGMITYTPRTGLQVVTGSFFRAWTRFSTEAGLGLPTSGETINKSGNRFQLFERGLIYQRFKTDVALVAFKADAPPALLPGAPAPAVSVPIDPKTAITKRGLSARLGIPRPESLFPVRTPTPRNNGFWQGFTNGWVYAREGDSPYIVTFPIFGEWGRTGWEQGPLGFPLSDARTLAPRPPPSGGDWPEEQFPNDRVQFFERGAVYFDASTNSTEVLTPDATGGTGEALALFSSASPNAPYGVRSGGADPGGKFVGIVTHGSRVWAAAETSGVWRSDDEGRSWRQTVVGMTHGYSQTARGGIPLAVDETGNRLLYATRGGDYRVNRLDGLFKTLDGGDNWQRVTFDPSVSSTNETAAVAFSRRNALALTGSDPRRLVLLRTDTANLTGWQQLTTPPVPFTTIAASPSSNSIFGCTGPYVYFSPDEGATWPGLLKVDGDCANISVPNTRGGRKAVVFYGKGGKTNTVEVATLDFTNDSVTVNNFNRPFIGSGKGFVQAIARSDSDAFESLDIFASDALDLYFSSRGSAWERVEGLHSDPWDVAFKQGYSPELGRCGVYLVNDGGVYANDFSGGGSCVAREGPWVLAQNGLHALNVYGAGGARLPAPFVRVTRDGSIAPSPNALYLSTAHNGSWAYADQVTGSESWNVVTRIPRPRESLTGPLIPNLGDSGGVYFDPALPNFVAFARGEINWWYRNDDGQTPPNSASPNGDMSPPKERWLDPLGPPFVATLSQVLTPPGLTPPERSDFFALFVSASPTERAWNNPNGLDDVVRNTNLTGWRSLNLTPEKLLCEPENFGCRFIQIQAVRRRSDTAVFLLGMDGKLRRLIVDSANVLTMKTRISDAVPYVLNFAVNPYDPEEIYISATSATEDPDSSASSKIMVTRDGGGRWEDVPVLTNLATDGGDYHYLGCRQIDARSITNCTGINSRPLQSMIFTRDALNVRVALLQPSNAIAYSNSGGRNWTVLSRHAYGEGDVSFLRTPKDLLGLSTSGFFIPYYRGGGVLYVGYAGRGLMRVDAPFEHLP